MIDRFDLLQAELGCFIAGNVVNNAAQQRHTTEAGDIVVIGAHQSYFEPAVGIQVV